MPAPFRQLNRAQFAELLLTFPFKRKINAVHMHHTWRPNRAQYRGHDSIVAMWRYHTGELGWSDIAQHISIAPDGSIWLGRDWNRPPASAAGHNGNEQAGPFMFEMIGDFDEGKDPFDGEQRSTALEVIARVQQRFGLAPGTLQLHSMMSAKTCPGSSIDYQTVLHDVHALHRQLTTGMRAAPQADSGPFADVEDDDLKQLVNDAIEDLQRGAGAPLDPPDAEPCQHDDDDADGAHSRTARAAGLSASDLQAMRPHIVNLRMGAFSSGGEWATSRSDVDAMFEEFLPAALTQARAEGRPLRLMFYAHGGLNSEAQGLDGARQRIGWWLKNGIYPIHFVWETGLAESLAQVIIGGQQGRAGRGILSDAFDTATEKVVRLAGGVKIWNSMKASARQASSPNVLGDAVTGNLDDAGGAWYVAERLGQFCQAHGAQVEVHAAGHSAGAIFHAHFIPCALAHGVPRVHSLHLLAPALRVDLFQQQLAPHVGRSDGIAHLAMYTMADSFEKDDSCGVVYRKSLLYLIHRALEAQDQAPILGLERCVRADPALKALFGLGAIGGAQAADIVWSDNGLDQGRSASRSHTHGGFDDDPATMGSVVRRVLGKADAERIVELPAQAARGADLWRAPVIDLSDYLGAAPQQMAPWTVPPPPAAYAWRERHDDSAVAPPRHPAASAWSRPPAKPAGGGRRLALCVGIDDYPEKPLRGCVNDARGWSDALARLGFGHPRQLFDRQATRAAIVGELRALIDGSRAGDVIVFQYAGHGMQVPDLDGDEGGDGLRTDQALCPHDYLSGEAIIDDDLRAMFDRLPDGVNLTCFFDCCYAGTITRMGLSLRPPPLGNERRVRSIVPDQALIERFTAKRAAQVSRGMRAGVGGGVMRDVSFSACRSDEEAGETAGHGDFTSAALRVLGRGIDGLTNAAFADRVTRAFGPSVSQHTGLLSSEPARAYPLLQALRGAVDRRAAATGTAGAGEPAYSYRA